MALTVETSFFVWTASISVTCDVTMQLDLWHFILGLYVCKHI